MLVYITPDQLDYPVMQMETEVSYEEGQYVKLIHYFK